MVTGQSGQTGRPAVRSAGREEELRLVTDTAAILHLSMEGEIVTEIIFKFSHAIIFPVSILFKLLNLIFIFLRQH